MEEIIYKKGRIIGKKNKRGMEFEFEIAIPTHKCDRYALLLEHDGLNDANVKSMLKLADEGLAPYCVNIGVFPAVQGMSDGEKYNRRINSYDLFNSEYADFVIFELIPYIEKEYGISFYDDPDMHYVSGGSSGGISAFVIGWFHPEFFRRVYMSSPSFLAMGRGNEIPYLIRKYETKPLRIYEEYSEFEPDEYFGASYPIDIEAERALKYAGYDYKYEYFSGEGHCSRYKNYDNAYERNKWIWRDYKTNKIVAPRNSPRIDVFLSPESAWERAETFPEKEVYKPNALDGNVVLSADKQFYYVSRPTEDVVYAHLVGDPSVENRSVHALLHTIPCVEPKGGIDIDVDVNDRLYVLTGGVGIQCVRSFGLIDAILDLPEGKPIEISVTDSIYVKTDLGIFKRALKPEYLENNRRMACDYYD